MWPIDWDRSRLDLGAAVEILSLFLVLVSKECHIILIQHMAYTWLKQETQKTVTWKISQSNKQVSPPCHP